MLYLQTSKAMGVFCMTSGVIWLGSCLYMLIIFMLGIERAFCTMDARTRNYVTVPALNCKTGLFSYSGCLCLIWSEILGSRPF